MSRPAWAEIDLGALRHNYLLAKRATNARALAVVKADAYGHGAEACARALEPVADGFAVAAIEEALALRAAGITKPVLLLEGFFEAAELADIVANNFWTVLHSGWQLDALLAANLATSIPIWLKLDSGMHRVGFDPSEYRPALERLIASGKASDIVLMSHFARADEPAVASTTEQLAVFQQATAGLDFPVSLSNSPAVLGWPNAHRDWVRPGMMLYGASPFDAPAAELPEPAATWAAQLRPVMNFEARIIAVRELPAGQPIGYGARYHTPAPTRVGVVACGYADGYPRHAPTGTPVLIDGQPSQLIGRVSMDMLTVDLTALPAAGVGSVVRLWGEGNPLERVAAAAGTIPYQLVCNVKRVARRYRDSD